MIDFYKLLIKSGNIMRVSYFKLKNEIRVLIIKKICFNIKGIVGERIQRLVGNVLAVVIRKNFTVLKNVS